MLNETKQVKAGDVWANEKRRTKVVDLFTRGGRWRVRYFGKNQQATQEAWLDVYMRNRTLVERDGKPVMLGAVPAEKVYAFRAAAAKAIFEYRRELLFFADTSAPEPWDVTKLGKARVAALDAMVAIARLDPEELAGAALSACANSTEKAGLRCLGLLLLPEAIPSDEAAPN